MDASNSRSEKNKRPTLTRVFLRGLTISLPPILTIVILIWAGRMLNDYVIYPISTVVQWSISLVIDESVPVSQLYQVTEFAPLEYCQHGYLVNQEEFDRLQRLLVEDTNEDYSRVRPEIENVYVSIGDSQRAVPYAHYRLVADNVRASELPTTVHGVYMELAVIRHFQGLFGLSAFAISISIIIVYFLGRLVTVRVGAWGVHIVETVLLGKLPVISNVYSSIKQVTDFLFSERTIEYNRIVAVEYPRRGIWSLGFAMSDSMLEITAAAGEPLVSVLIPTSPMPMTGYTVNVPKSEVLDLNLTVDQAFQFCLSCGVLIPPQQRVTSELLQRELAKRLAGMTAGATRPDPPRPMPLPSETPNIASGFDAVPENPDNLPGGSDAQSLESRSPEPE